MSIANLLSATFLMGAAGFFVFCAMQIASAQFSYPGARIALAAISLSVAFCAGAIFKAGFGQ